MAVGLGLLAPIAVASPPDEPPTLARLQDGPADPLVPDRLREYATDGHPSSRSWSPIEAAPGTWVIYPRGMIRKDRPGARGDHFFAKELDLEAGRAGGSLRWTVRPWRRFGFAGDAFALFVSGSANPERPKYFDGLLVLPDQPVRATIGISSVTLAARGAPFLSRYVDLGLELGARYYRLETEFSQGGTAPGRVREVTGALIPFIGVGGVIRVPGWSAEDLSLDLDARLGRLPEGPLPDHQRNWQAHFVVRLVVPLGADLAGLFGFVDVRLTIGYEYLFVDASRNDDGNKEDLDIEFHGPTFALLLRF